MSKNTRFWVIVPAAGTSQRMSEGVPKQYLPFGDATVIEASISNFLAHPKVAKVVIALHEKDVHWNTLAVSKNEKIHTIEGGSSRAKSVHNALQYLDNTSAASEDFVLVHDAARPCLRKSDLDSLIQQLEEDDVGGILASPISDTLKIVDQLKMENNIVSKTLDREYIWRAFTPQMFRLNTLKKALAYCAEQDITVTDEASAIEAIGLQVKLITGRGDNIKITHSEDLILASMIYKNINL